MAEQIFRALVEQDGLQTKIFCQSAGIAAADGSPASPEAVTAISEIGGDLTRHRARRLGPDDTQVWDLFFPMSATHAYILEQAGVEANRIYVPQNIADPFGQGLAVYRECRDRLQTEIEEFYQGTVKRLMLLSDGYEVGKEKNAGRNYT